MSQNGPAYKRDGNTNIVRGARERRCVECLRGIVMDASRPDGSAPLAVEPLGNPAVLRAVVALGMLVRQRREVGLRLVDGRILGLAVAALGTPALADDLLPDDGERRTLAEVV